MASLFIDDEGRLLLNPEKTGLIYGDVCCCEPTADCPACPKFTFTMNLTFTPVVLAPPGPPTSSLEGIEVLNGNYTMVNNGIPHSCRWEGSSALEVVAPNGWVWNCSLTAIWTNTPDGFAPGSTGGYWSIGIQGHIYIDGVPVSWGTEWYPYLGGTPNGTAKALSEGCPPSPMNGNVACASSGTYYPSAFTVTF